MVGIDGIFVGENQKKLIGEFSRENVLKINKNTSFILAEKEAVRPIHFGPELKVLNI